MARSSSPFSLFKKDFLCSIEMSSMMRCLLLWSSAINTGIISELMLWPFGRQCSPLHLTQDWCSSTGHKGIPRSHKYFKGIFCPFTIQSLDHILKLGLEVANDEYIILCNKGCRWLFKSPEAKKNDRSDFEKWPVGVWSHLGCSGQNTMITFSREGLV